MGTHFGDDIPLISRHSADFSADVLTLPAFRSRKSCRKAFPAEKCPYFKVRTARGSDANLLRHKNATLGKRGSISSLLLPTSTSGCLQIHHRNPWEPLATGPGLGHLSHHISKHPQPGNWALLGHFDPFWGVLIPPGAVYSLLGWFSSTRGSLTLSGVV